MDTRLAGEPTAVLLGSQLHLKRLRFCNLFFYLIKVEMWPGILYYSADTSFVICRAARLLSLLTDSRTTWWIDKITVRALGPYKLPRSSGDADFVRAGKLHSVKLRPFNIRRWCLVQNALAADLLGASKLREGISCSSSIFRLYKCAEFHAPRCICIFCINMGAVHSHEKRKSCPFLLKMIISWLLWWLFRFLRSTFFP